MRALIIGSGSILDYEYIGKMVSDRGHIGLVICCDGGARHAKKLKLMPDYIVGDLDSIDKDVLDYYEHSVRFEKYSPMKDYSDMEIGLNKAIELGASEIVFIGATGDRADHSLSNIGLLYNCLLHEIKAGIIDDNNCILMINNKTVLPLKKGQTVSLLPFTEAASGLTTTGLLYPLNNESLKWGTTRGISNVCSADNPVVDIKSGILILVMPTRP